MTPVQPGEASGRSIRPLAGGSLDPRDIVGRDATIDEMRRLLSQGVDLVINDPRRMGKTCLLDRFAYLTSSPWTTVKIDYEGVATADEFLRRTMDALRANERIRGRVIESVRSFIDNIEVDAGPLRINAAFQARSPTDILDESVRRIDQRLQGDERLILALDEVPLAIENIAQNETPLGANTLLQTMRRLRQQTKSIRWVVTGSIGFHHVLRRAGTTEGAINDLFNVPCGPLDYLWAWDLATMLLRGIDAAFDDDVVTALVDVSGRIPFLLQHLANLLRGLDGPCTASSIHQAWETFVADRDHSKAVTHLLTRIDPYYGTQAPVAKKVLDILAMSPRPMSAGAIANDVAKCALVLDDLVDDHYLIERPDGLSWRYPVLRKIWIARRRLA